MFENYKIISGQNAVFFATLNCSNAEGRMMVLGSLSADSETRDPNPTLYYRPQICCDHGWFCLGVLRSITEQSGKRCAKEKYKK